MLQQLLEEQMKEEVLQTSAAEEVKKEVLQTSSVEEQLKRAKMEMTSAGEGCER